MSGFQKFKDYFVLGSMLSLATVVGLVTLVISIAVGLAVPSVLIALAYYLFKHA